MKQRTGKECKKFKCAYWITYANWAKNLGNSSLENCINCKNAHVSQYVKGGGIEWIHEKR
jgi:ribulose bisphosphate carboxylase small subunit